MKNKLELLAPAGSKEKMETAFAFGADAVYLGTPDFSLRVRINRFSAEEVKQAIIQARGQGKKVYVTLNIYAHNRHLSSLITYLRQLEKWRPDGLIISDPGVLALAKKYAPHCPIHLSTQANATNWSAVRFWKQQGVKRVILGREVSLDEIREIKKMVPGMELEYFVHGAMCLSYSGRCVLSAWLANRSANLGDCVQPCRWQYDVRQVRECQLATGRESEQEITMEEDAQGTYLLNSQDLCLLEYLDDLAQAGITSFKIEGRAKSVAYLAIIIKAYREGLTVIDSFHNQALVKRKLRAIKKKRLLAIMHRGYTTGFLLGKTGEQLVTASHLSAIKEFVGEIVGGERDGKKKQYHIFFQPHNRLVVGEEVFVITPQGRDLRLKVNKLYNGENKMVGAVHGGGKEKASFYSRFSLPIGSILQKKI
ncbi:MAG TPA: U32 family peptidase [Patescibacteria group bacterium]|nr:U32 family peptidase [Patescibacteria group bacterium]